MHNFLLVTLLLILRLLSYTATLVRQQHAELINKSSFPHASFIIWYIFLMDILLFSLPYTASLVRRQHAARRDGLQPVPSASPAAAAQPAGQCARGQSAWRSVVLIVY